MKDIGILLFITLPSVVLSIKWVYHLNKAINRTVRDGIDKVHLKKAMITLALAIIQAIVVFDILPYFNII